MYTASMNVNNIGKTMHPLGARFKDVYYFQLLVLSRVAKQNVNNASSLLLLLCLVY